MQTILTRTDLSRLSIGYSRPDGTNVRHTFHNNGQGELVSDSGTTAPSPILQPVEPDGTDSHPNEPLPPPPPTLELDNVIVWNPSAAEFFAEHGPTPIAEVDFMNLSANILKLVRQYMERVEDEEHPAEGIQKGFTPLELGNRRRAAHNKLMQELTKEGISFPDRSDVTDFARKCDQWLRD